MNYYNIIPDFGQILPENFYNPGPWSAVLSILSRACFGDFFKYLEWRLIYFCWNMWSFILMVNNTTSCFCWCSLNRLDLACFRTASAELLWCVNKLKRWTAPVMRAPFGTWAGYRRYVQTLREWSWQRTCGSMFFTWKRSRCFVSLSVTHTENCSNRCLDMMSACWLVLFMFFPRPHLIAYHC